MAEKLKYAFNPYTFARVSAMKSLLLQKADYDKIMKMDPSEIIKFLQEGVYGQEINALAVKYDGLKLAENALNRHLVRITKKLLVITDPSIKFLMMQYLKRYDFWNLKTLFRAKLSNLKETDLDDILLPLGSLGLERLKRLYSKDVREIIGSCGLINPTNFNDAVSEFENTKNLASIENLLEYHYLLDSVEFAKNIPEEGKLFKEFFRYEFDVYNLKLILKKIFLKLDKKAMESFVIYEGKDLTKRTIKNLFDSENVNDFIKEISKTKYRDVIKKEDGNDPLLRYEVLLEGFLYSRSILLFHQHPLTVDMVLGYMFAKEIEIRNLRTIIKSKKLEFAEDYVKSLIIIRAR